MEKFKVTSKYSTISIVDLAQTSIENDYIIIQAMKIEHPTGFNVMLEVVHKNNIEDYRNENNRQATASLEAEDTQKPKKTDEQMQLENDLETILNSDPFSKGKYSGKTLRYIYENDIKWVEYAIEHLNNTYIKDKLINIKKCESLWL